MPKKNTALTIEERLQQALVPAEKQPYEVPENWVWVRLGEVVDVLNGDRGKNYPAKSTLSKEGIPFISAANLCDNIVVEDDLLCMSEEQYSKLSAGKLMLNDIVLCIRGSLGKHGKFPFKKGAIASSLVILRSKDRGRLTDGYVMQYLDVPLFYDEIKKYDNGTAQPNLAAKNLELFSFPLPPLSEQQRIVERIEELFAKLDEAKERLQEVVDSFAVRKAAILHKAFTGELTKQWRRENGVSDESWEEKKGEDFFEYVTSGSRGWAKYYSDKGSIFVRMGNLNHGTIELDFSDIQYVELPDQVEGQRSKLQKNDILISITADVGMIGLVREDMDAYINQHVALARPKNDLYAEFLAWYFVSDVGLQQMQNKQRGATKIGLGLQDIRSIILKIPSLSEQHEIVRLIDDLLARERAAQQATEQALASIDLMKKSILARAFRGELGTNKASEASALELLKQVLAED